MLNFNLTLYQLRSLENLIQLMHGLTMSSGADCINIEVSKSTEGVKIRAKAGVKDGQNKHNP
jgi:hypothetical protein